VAHFLHLSLRAAQGANKFIERRLYEHMTAEWLRRKYLRIGRLALAIALVVIASRASASVEQTFPVLQIGTQVYSNVTVTTKSKTYIFLLHSTGMANIKVADLSPELRETLGYASPGVTLSKNSASAAATWVKKEINHLNISNVQARNLREESQARIDKLKTVPRKQLYLVFAIVVVFWFLRCACHAMICQKAGSPPGMLIWIPLLKLIPLLKAAKMSLGWVFLFLLPLGALVVDIVWSFKIATARGKGALTGLCLILPGINFFAFLYLAFSDGAPAAKPMATRSRLMTLETA
jgi:hypothetical protein